MFFRAITQFGAEAEKLGGIVSPATPEVERWPVAAKWNLFRRIECQVKPAEIPGQNQSRLDAQDFTSGLVAFGINLAGKSNVNRKRALLKETIARLQACRVKVKTVASLMQGCNTGINHPMVGDAILQSKMMSHKRHEVVAPHIEPILGLQFTPLQGDENQGFVEVVFTMCIYGRSAQSQEQPNRNYTTSESHG